MLLNFLREARKLYFPQQDLNSINCNKMITLLLPPFFIENPSSIKLGSELRALNLTPLNCKFNVPNALLINWTYQIDPWQFVNGQIVDRRVFLQNWLNTPNDEFLFNSSKFESTLYLVHSFVHYISYIVSHRITPC